MNLGDFKPCSVSVEIDVQDSTGQDTTFEISLRPYTLKDEAWIEQTYKTKEALAKIFEKIDMPEICRMVFYQSTLETKKKIMAVKVVDMDELGNEFETCKTGPEKLMSMVQGFGQGVRLFKALLECKGLSMPLIEQVAEEELKKKGMLKEDESLTGVLSTI